MSVRPAKLSSHWLGAKSQAWGKKTTPHCRQPVYVKFIAMIACCSCHHCSWNIGMQIRGPCGNSCVVDTCHAEVVRKLVSKHTVHLVAHFVPRWATKEFIFFFCFWYSFWYSLPKMHEPSFKRKSQVPSCMLPIAGFAEGPPGTLGPPWASPPLPAGRGGRQIHRI